MRVESGSGNAHSVVEGAQGARPFAQGCGAKVDLVPGGAPVHFVEIVTERGEEGVAGVGDASGEENDFGVQGVGE